MLKFANVTESNFASLLRRSFIFKIQALFVDKSGPQRTPADGTGFLWLRQTGSAHPVAWEPMAERRAAPLSCMYLHEHGSLRSYIDDKFPEGPANGVFPRDPDLRDFVAVPSATARLACVDRSALVTASGSCLCSQWSVLVASWLVGDGMLLLVGGETPAILGVRTRHRGRTDDPACVRADAQQGPMSRLD